LPLGKIAISIMLKDAQVLGDVIDAFAAWFEEVIAPLGRKS
jgi:hypothetical protein